MKSLSEFEIMNDPSVLQENIDLFTERTRIAFKAIGKIQESIITEDEEFSRCLEKHLEGKWGTSPASIKKYLKGSFGQDRKQVIDFFNAILDYLNAHEELACFFTPQEEFNKDDFNKKIKECWYGKYKKPTTLPGTFREIKELLDKAKVYLEKDDRITSADLLLFKYMRSSADQLLKTVNKAYMFIIIPALGLFTKTKTASASTKIATVSGLMLLILTIDALYDRNEFKRVDSICTNLIAIHNSEPKLYHRKAWAEKKLSRYSNAIADFDKMIELASKKKNEEAKFKALYGKGIVLNRMGEYAKAVEIFNQARRLKPSNKSVIFHLSISLKRDGKNAEAVKYFHELLPYYSNILKKNPSDLRSLTRQAYILMTLKKYKESLLLLSRALEIHPDLETTLFHRGYVYYILGRYQEALEDYNKSITLNPDDEQVYRLRALVYGALKKYDDQLNDLNKRLEIKPNSSNGYLLRALFFRSQGHYSAAIIDLGEAIKNEPNKSIYFEHRGDIYAELKKYPEAASDYIEALKLDSDNANLQTKTKRVINSLIKHGETDVALNNLNIIIKSDPKNETVLIDRGSLFLQLKKFDSALLDFEKALKINPQNKTAYANVGDCYVKETKYREALKSYENALKIDPKYEYAVKNKNLVLQLMENKKKRAHSHFPGFKKDYPL